MTTKYSLSYYLSIAGVLVCSILFVGEALQMPTSYSVSEFSGPRRTTYMTYDHNHHPGHKRSKSIMRPDQYQTAMRHLRKQKAMVAASPVEIDAKKINSQMPIIAYIAKDFSNDLKKYFAESSQQKRSRA